MLNVRLISTAMLSVAVLLVGSVSNLAQSGGPIVFTANLTATQEAPAPADSTPATAGGFATLLFNPADSTLTFAVAYSGLSGTATLAHFHGALPGVSGGVVQTVCGVPSPALAGNCPSNGNSGFLQGVWNVPADQVNALVTGQLYLNIHTDLNKGGEIRGQVLPR